MPNQRNIKQPSIESGCAIPKDFLKHFKGKHIFVSGSDKTHESPHHHKGDYSDVEETLKLDNKSNERGVFFTVNELDQSLDPEKYRTKKMVTRIRAVWVEDDVPRKEPRKDFPIQPNIIVNSSSSDKGKKYHYYWLTSTEDFETFKKVQNVMVSRHGSDPNAKDITRYLRLPGFNHLKNEPHQVTFEVIREKSYDWQVITIAFPPDSVEVKPTVAVNASNADIPKTVAELNKAYKKGHKHGPSSRMAMKLVNGVKRDEMPDVLKQMYPDVKAEHHIESLRTGFNKKDEESISLADEFEEPAFNEAPEMPMELMLRGDDFDGLINEIVDFTIRRKNLPAATANALALTRFLVDANYATVEGGLLVSMDMVIGGSSSGKSQTTAAANRILAEVKPMLMKRIQGTLSTKEGLETILELNESTPSVLVTVDEVASMFKEINGRKKSSGSLREVLMELMSLGAKPYITRPLSQKPSKTINLPCINVLGNTTPENMEGSFSKIDRSNGFVQRMVFVCCDHKVKQKLKPPKSKVVTLIKDRLSEIQESNRHKGTRTIDQAFRVEMTEAAYAQFLEIDKKVMNGNIEDAVYKSKWAELAIKYSTTRAIYNNPQDPVVDLDLFQWALDYVDYSYKVTDWLFKEHVANNELERAKKEVVRLLEKNDGRLTRSQMSLKSNYFGKLKPHEKDALIREMAEKEGRIIVEEKRGGNGRKMEIYKLPKNNKSKKCVKEKQQGKKVS